MNSAAVRFDLLVGAAPWLLYGMGKWGDMPMEGAFFAALLILTLRLKKFSETKLYEISIFLYFALVSINRFFAISPWIQRHEAALAPGLLTCFVLGSCILGKPYTLQYAREMVPSSWWKNFHFIRVNQILTWVWGGVFLAATCLTELHLRWGIPSMWLLTAISVGFSVGAFKFTQRFPYWYRLHVYLPRVRAGLEPHLLREERKSRPRNRLNSQNP